jgi:hypothetical protein
MVLDALLDARKPTPMLTGAAVARPVASRRAGDRRWFQDTQAASRMMKFARCNAAPKFFNVEDNLPYYENVS